MAKTCVFHSQRHFNLKSDFWSSGAKNVRNKIAGITKNKKFRSTASEKRNPENYVPEKKNAKKSTRHHKPQSAKDGEQVIFSSYVKPAKLDALLRDKCPGGNYFIEVGTLRPLLIFGRLTFP
jgi:hypothetical protein